MTQVGARHYALRLFREKPAVLVLAGTELWEAFSYFGMRTVLVYYLTGELGYSIADASALYGTYSAAAYLTPILGGWVADRWLGRQRAVILGCVMKMIGYIGLALGGAPWPLLTVVVVGNGLFLPTLPATMGSLFPADDPDRQQGFTIYYFCVALGGFLAPLGCGTVGELYGWHYSFAVSAAGMGIALVTFLAGRHLLPEHTPSRPEVRDPSSAAGTFRGALAYLSAILFAVIVLRIAYEQLGNAVALFAAGDVDRRLPWGQEVPYTWFQSLNPLGVILFTPLMLWIWTKLGQRPEPMSELTRMAIGSAIIGAAFLGLGLAAAHPGPRGVSWMVLSAFFLVLTFGELWVLPVGLSLFARLAPPSHASVVLAFWSSARAGGNFLSGLAGRAVPALGFPVFFLASSASPFIAAALFVAIGVVLRGRSARRPVPGTQP